MVDCGGGCFFFSSVVVSFEREREREREKERERLNMIESKRD